jgi:hypothetical protein
MSTPQERPQRKCGHCNEQGHQKNNCPNGGRELMQRQHAETKRRCEQWKASDEIAQLLMKWPLEEQATVAWRSLVAAQVGWASQIHREAQDKADASVEAARPMFTGVDVSDPRVRVRMLQDELVRLDAELEGQVRK